MKQKELWVRTLSSFVIMCVLFGIMNNTGSGLLVRPSIVSEYSSADDGCPNQSSLRCSSDILQMIQQVNTSTLQRYIQTIQGFGPHPTGSEALEAVGSYLYTMFNSFPLSVTYDPWRYKFFSGNNIVATLEGRENRNIIVVNAHYDSVSISPGANDDGSGIAIVLAAAKILSQYDFNCTIRFVLFSGEEQGLLGSHEYAKNASRNGENIIGDLTLDGVGYAVTSEDGSKIKHLANNQSTWMVDISKSIASRYHDEIGLDVIGFPHVTFSDHQSFVRYNYDASYLWEYACTPYYHTSEDTLEHMNMTYLTKICKLTIGILASIAELQPRLSNDDLDISIKGRTMSYPCQFYVRIENTKSMIDTANVTIDIAIKNLRSGQYVITMIHTDNITCHWTFTKEIETVWEFKISGRHYTNQFISLEVIVRGKNDDVTLYSSEQRIGVILHDWIVLFPFF